MTERWEPEEIRKEVIELLLKTLPPSATIEDIDRLLYKIQTLIGNVWDAKQGNMTS